MQTNEHYYSLTKDEYNSLDAKDKIILQDLRLLAIQRVNRAYSALAEVIVAGESAKGE